MYLEILDRHSILEKNFIMIGNSIKSDILPVLNIGSRAIYIPYKCTWMHEDVIISPLTDHYVLLKEISLVFEWLNQNT